MTVIDVHTHMLTRDYIELLRTRGGPELELKKTKAGQDTVWYRGSPFFTLFEPMWNYELRIRDMDKAGVDVAIVSLTCPNAYWGGREVSLKAAQLVNDSMAEQQRARPDRIRWFASLPWQYADDAKAELARCLKNGAVGVMVIANIAGEDLTHPKFAAVWQAIDDAKLPVLVHPGAPAGAKEMHLDEFGLVPPVGFMFDTTLAFARMIYAGFLDKFPNVKLIASHGGAALPYLAGRLDQCWQHIPACAEVIKEKPSEYLKRIWYDTVVYDPRALDLCISVAGGADRVLYGSDYPHNIGDMAGCLARVNGRPKDEAMRIAGRNAERLFGL
jgi:aminocarboxymuconate-semialdehyde decarboxylase